MKRRDDWVERLNETVRAALARPFAWGTHDCATFAADCVLAMTGADPAARWRGTYATALGAQRALFHDGLWDLAALGDRLFGPPIAPAYAQRGDVVLAPLDGHMTAAVVVGAIAVGPARDGLRAVAVAEATRAWAVARIMG